MSKRNKNQIVYDDNGIDPYATLIVIMMSSHLKLMRVKLKGKN